MQQTYVSCCKINLGLEVLNRREDGFHDINTVFYKVSEPHDEFLVEASDGFHFSTSEKSIPDDESNIVVRAFMACSEAAGIKMPNLRIYLRKHVPSGAGLGGGSADAATAIKIFKDHCAAIPGQEAQRIAVQLGADVSFFMGEAQAMVGSGIGEQLQKIELTFSSTILLIKIKEAFISTANAYALLRLKSREKPTDFADVLKLRSPSQWQHVITNDFEEVAFAIHPILFTLKQRLYEFGADFALMSGSGAAFFAMFANRVSALSAREKLLTDFPGCAVFIS